MKKLNIKVGRNDACPCGSGLKFKKCCEGKEAPIPVNLDAYYRKKYDIHLKKEADIEAIRKAGALVVETHKRVEEMIRPGLKTDDINAFVHEFTLKNGAVPAPLNYKGYPKSVCISVNDVICHGIPGDQILADGDIVNVDITSILNGYYADSNQTLFVGTPGPDAQKIVAVARESLRAGLSMVKPGNTIGDIGWAIQSCAEAEHCSVVREFIGHGIGFDFHESPQVPHFGKRNKGIRLVPGMVFTVEPMINLGGPRLYILDDHWTAVTADGSLSAQFEETIVVTQDGYESLTPMGI
ncbi:MAG: type I methionyl aminopeptidase [Proteobacteria bacterium]|nr:type I methionyl aminopeptidase [Pseudomonadota bacterium]